MGGGDFFKPQFSILSLLPNICYFTYKYVVIWVYFWGVILSVIGGGVIFCRDLRRGIDLFSLHFLPNLTPTSIKQMLPKVLLYNNSENYWCVLRKSLLAYSASGTWVTFTSATGSLIIPIYTKCTLKGSHFVTKTPYKIVNLMYVNVRFYVRLGVLKHNTWTHSIQKYQYYLVHTFCTAHHFVLVYKILLHSVCSLH